MGFSRATVPAELTGESLTAAMASIGMEFAAAAREPANIEDTLLFASIEAIEKPDLRVLAILATWFGVHHERVNASRLTELVSRYATPRARALWSAFATWQANDRRFSRLGALRPASRVEVLPVGTELQIRRHGEDARFQGTALRVPANVLRDRPGDVLAPAVLARRHDAYRFRIMMGPSFRADLWAALEGTGGRISAAELARSTYASFASAWHAKRDFLLLHPAIARRGRAA